MIKRVVLLLVVSFLTVKANFFEDYQDFARLMRYETDYAQARAKALKERKMLFVLYVKDGCPFCTKLEEEVLTDKYVRTYIKKHYIPLIVNEYRKNFPDYLYSTIAPVTYIIDPNTQTIVKKIIGYMEVDQYLWQF